jgi:hypothetical protein
MNGDFFKAWRVADRNAHLFEKVLAKASIDALTGLGPAPTNEAQEQARQMRAAADALFIQAMAQMRDRATHSRW